MTGVAKASNKPYDMGKLVILVPVENMASEKMTRVGYGAVVNELDVLPDAIPNKFNFHYPCELDLVVDRNAQARGGAGQGQADANCDVSQRGP